MYQLSLILYHHFIICKMEELFGEKHILSSSGSLAWATQNLTKKTYKFTNNQIILWHWTFTKCIHGDVFVFLNGKNNLSIIGTH